MLLTSAMFANISRGQPPSTGAFLWISPPEFTVSTGSAFSVNEVANTSTPIVEFLVYLHYDPSEADGLGATVYPPYTMTYISSGVGWMEVGGIDLSGVGVGGGVNLVNFELICLKAGVVYADPTDQGAFLLDAQGGIIPILGFVAAVGTQTWIFKPPYVDYAPSGVPDFSQKQAGPLPIAWWQNNYSQWSWCGPTAAADSLWWMDSRFETKNVPFLIANLSRYMDTDGVTSGTPHNGTEVHDMVSGIQNYIRDHGLQDKFYVDLLAKPTFDCIAGEVKRCEDSILLLGFWQPSPHSPSGFVRIGGHFVTVPGVDSNNSLIYFCDPYTDNAELTGQGYVYPPPPHAHPAPPDRVHNNATFVSFDAYTANTAGPSPSPGGTLGIYYNLTQYYDLFSNVQEQNCPHEFENMQGTYNMSLPVFTEVEYGVFMSPTPPPMYWKPGHPDYAPSGMVDFDERQWGTRNWTDLIWHTWSYCAPVAEANSLWWLDSEFESGSTPPPTMSDHFNLVTSYNASGWDDHDPRNVPYLIEHLAYLMDTDGQRTANATGKLHTGTNVTDMQTGLAQYLQWAGVNPIGDVNGDGEVNATDLAIVVAANNTHAGMPGWNMAADIYPVTLGWPTPGTADNIVNQSDIDLVNAHMGEKGMFYERTIPAPDFSLIEDEVQKCEDVVLTVGFWTWDGMTQQWYKEDTSPYPYPSTGKYGHALTVAGVNSTTLKIAVSDPAFDAFEQGLTPEGRSPVPHVHNPPEPPYTTHNNASLVSQDIYNMAWIQPPLPPCPGGNWTIVGYGGYGAMPPAPGTYVVVENAVVLSPVGVHDVAVTNITRLDVPTDGSGLEKTVVGQGYPLYVNVTVADLGDFAETFNVTLYANHAADANTTMISTQLGVALAAKGTATLTFKWNTTGYAYGNYTLTASAEIVVGETYTANNNLTSGKVLVTIAGDISGGDGWGTVFLSDLGVMAAAWTAFPTSPNWNPNADITGIGQVFLPALGAMAANWGVTVTLPVGDP
jgi:hypothetical protein